MPGLYQCFACCQFHQFRAYLARLKDDGFITIDEYSILYMEPHSLSKRPAFHIPPFTDQVFNSITMVALYNILRNNRSLVKFVSYIMGSGPNQLYSALKCFLIGICANERRQKTMMNVNDLASILFDKERLQYLHITSKHQEIYLSPQKVEHTHLIFSALFFAHGKVVVGNTVHLSKRLQVMVITDNEGNIHRQFAAFPAPEQVCKAMVEL